MNDAILRGLGYAAAELAKRDKTEIWITLKDGRVLSGLYDPMFKTIILGGATFPDAERNLWVRLFYGSTITSIKKGK